MEGSIERARVAINAMRARLTILGFNLAITTFQISNTRGLGGGSHFEGFETTVHLGAGMVLLTGVALSSGIRRRAVPARSSTWAGPVASRGRDSGD